MSLTENVCVHVCVLLFARGVCRHVYVRVFECLCVFVGVCVCV